MPTEQRKTKIVCTLGPASQDEEVIGSLIEAGMNVARLNFSHGSYEFHQMIFDRIQRQAKKRGAVVTVLQDLCGPKIRLGKVKEGVELRSGDTIRLTSDSVIGDEQRVSISYPLLAQEVQVGNRILIDDGLIELLIESIDGDDLIGRVVVGGSLRSNKGVNLPNVALSIEAVTEKDIQDLKFGLKMGVDFVALSFVRKPDDILLVKKVMKEVGIFRPIIVKIEKGEALACLRSIIDSADGVMVARGDLGVEVPLEEVPVVQKEIVKQCLRKAKPVIIATQMLDSMIENPRPTRAEVNDVANAILDGTDAVMLSGETAVGEYPVRTVQVMSRIALRTEQNLDYESFNSLSKIRGNPMEAVAVSACQIAMGVSAAAIVACSKTGRTARAISRYRPESPILGITPDPEISRQLNLSWGVSPVLVPPYYDTDELMENAVAGSLSVKGIRKGNLVVIVAGVPLGNPTNLIRLRNL